MQYTRLDASLSMVKQPKSAPNEPRWRRNYFLLKLAAMGLLKQAFADEAKQAPVQSEITWPGNPSLGLLERAFVDQDKQAPVRCDITWPGNVGPDWSLFGFLGENSFQQNYCCQGESQKQWVTVAVGSSVLSALQRVALCSGMQQYDAVIIDA